MGLDPFDPDKMTAQKSVQAQFKEDRLERESLDKSQWPAQIDRAALDIQYGIAVGKSDQVTDIGGVIGRHDFDRATGEFYVEGLSQLAGENSSVARALRQYQDKRIGELVFQLNSFRYKLDESGQNMDIDRALEAFLEKQAASAIDRSSYRDKNAGAGLRTLRNTDSVADLTLKLFSDPSTDAYAEQLLENLPDSTAESDELLRQLDEPRMTTPLWGHQRTALSNWVENDQRGYVDMATATGKTVLGLAAIAYRYGELHPADREWGLTSESNRVDERPRVLIVAGNEVILKQWRDEFDEHLDIPKGRTEPIESEDGATIELDWGDIEFRTAQGLLDQSDFSRYDLTILDEAHRYTRGSSGGRAWGDLFADLTTQSSAVLAMSGSVDGGWSGDTGAREALEDHLEQCISFGVPKARDRGVIADFTWEVHYAPATEADEQKLSNQTNITRSNYDPSTGQLDTESLKISADDLPSSFRSYSDIRSFAQSNRGNKLRERSKEFDMFASALLTRRPLRWNMSPVFDAIGSLVDRHAPRKKTVVLVQSYEEVEDLQKHLIEKFGHADDQIVALESSNIDRHAKIKQFNDLESGVIIGPGNLLGVGVNMPDAEVAINIARGGVNASLVQRIGRVLRNPGGNKQAQFYHIVPQPTSEEALDYVEDGADLLRQAAEFNTLGETFKQPPAFATSNEQIDSTLIKLENNGVELLERIEDTDELVDADRADEHLRRLQADIYDANSASEGPRQHPVLTTNWDGRVEEQDEDDDLVFPERNESYERYRLTLSPYRAAKAVATNHLDIEINIDETDEGYQVDLPKEYENTDYHTELERWLNEYRQWRDRCDNREGDGEPSSLPVYKEHWPEPREEDGAMLTAEAAATIGIDYAGSDPIFFPRIDDGVYELPLPTGEWLTVEGITEKAPDERTTESNSPQFTISIFALQAAQNASQNGDYDTLDEFVEDTVSDLLKNALDDSQITDLSRTEVPQQQVKLDLPERLVSMAEYGRNNCR
jgi:superfamily II DNA or RNA helicase